MNQFTLRSEAEVSGKGLHKGGDNRVIIRPAGVNTGLMIRNKGFEYALEPNAVLDTKRGTTVRYKGSVVHTVEHLVSALRGLSIDNAIIEIEGDEPPAVDGSSFPYVQALKKSGLKEQRGQKARVKVTRPFLLKDGDKYLAVLPAGGFMVSYFSDFTRFNVPRMDYEALITPAVYIREISKARTFGFKSEINWLIKAGLIKGASLENAILMEGGRPANGPLRYKDELVRHKVLDIVGDFGMLGANLEMHVIAIKTGHKQNVEMARRIAEVQGPGSGVQV